MFVEYMTAILAGCAFAGHGLFCAVRLGRAEGVAMFVLYLMDNETHDFETTRGANDPASL